MTLAAFLIVWIGTGLVALGTFVLTWHDGSTFYRIAEQTLESNPLDLTGAANIYASLGWYAIIGLIVVVGLFTMFTGPRDKWIAVAGQVLLAGGIGYGTYAGLQTLSDRSDLQTRLMYVLYAAAAIALLMAVAAMARRAFAGAFTVLLAAAAGAVLSIMMITSGVPTGGSYSMLAWTVPVGYVLLFLGSLVSIAVFGKNRTEHPTDRPKKDQPPAAENPGWNASSEPAS